MGADGVAMAMVREGGLRGRGGRGGQGAERKGMKGGRGDEGREGDRGLGRAMRGWKGPEEGGGVE